MNKKILNLPEKIVVQQTKSEQGWGFIIYQVYGKIETKEEEGKITVTYTLIEEKEHFFPPTGC